MSIHELKPEGIEPLPRTTFQQAGLKEREDLQRLLRDQIEVVDPDVLVLAEEFGHWDGSRRRIDLLGLDREANLVVIELKRSEDGGHMELQALRYAAMVSRMTFEQAVQARQAWMAGLGRQEDSEQAILEFLEWGEAGEGSFGDRVRLVLVAGDFSKEVCTSVLWLGEQGLDIRCVRLRLYSDQGRTLADVQQVLPLPEASEYLIGIREKQAQERRAKESARDHSRLDLVIAGETQPGLAKRRAMLEYARALFARGVHPEQLAEALPWRGRRLWRVAEGRLDGAAFDEVQAQQDGAWDPVRWFARDGELLYAQGRTWALTNQWGGQTRRAIQVWQERFPQPGLEVREAA